MTENHWQVMRAAEKHGMTTEAWIAHCDAVEARERGRRRIERVMRAVPQYRAAAA